MGPVGEPRDQWRAAGEAVIHRRVEKGMRTRAALAQATGLTVKTLGEIERGERPSYDPATLAAVEQALEWPAGQIRRLLDGTIAVDTGVVYTTGRHEGGKSGLLAEVLRGAVVSAAVKAEIQEQAEAASVATGPDGTAYALAQPSPPKELLWELGLEQAPEPPSGQMSFAEWMRYLKRDPFLLATLLYRAELLTDKQFGVLLEIRKRQQAHEIELLKEAAELIRQAGGTVPDEVWPPAWLDESAGGEESS